jgi:hypothetical protein
VELQCSGDCSLTGENMLKLIVHGGVARRHTSIAKFGVIGLVESDNEYISSLGSIKLS